MQITAREMKLHRSSAVPHDCKTNDIGRRVVWWERPSNSHTLRLEQTLWRWSCLLVHHEAAREGLSHYYTGTYALPARARVSRNALIAHLHLTKILTDRMRYGERM